MFWNGWYCYGDREEWQCWDQNWDPFRWVNIKFLCIKSLQKLFCRSLPISMPEVWQNVQDYSRSGLPSQIAQWSEAIPMPQLQYDFNDQERYDPTPNNTHWCEISPMQRVWQDLQEPKRSEIPPHSAQWWEIFPMPWLWQGILFQDRSYSTLILNTL